MERIYTVHRALEDTPCITIKGKWLRGFGIDLGDKLKLVEMDGVFVLAKIPEGVSERDKLEMEMKDLKKKMGIIERRLAL